MAFLGTSVFIIVLILVYGVIWYIFSISVLTKLGCIITLIVGGFYSVWAFLEETKLVLNILYIIGAVVVLAIIVLSLPLVLGSLAFLGILAACTLTT